MEFPDTGKQCCYMQCKQLDFLPVPCTGCGQVFCSAHFQPTQHTCTQTDHSVKEKLTVGIATLHTCAQDTCKAVSSMHIACDCCNQHFCLAHRHHGCHEVNREQERVKWETPQRQFKAAKEEADRQVEQSLHRAQRSTTKSRTAGKVRLMRLKGRATGPSTVPATQRCYFLVHLPIASRSLPTSRAVFVSRTWSLGRSVDSIATTCNIPNRNNEVQAHKLRLFRREDGQSLGNDMGVALEQLLEQEIVVDGDSVILEYVSETTGAAQSLDNVEHYKE